jgi:hypothetical protein
MCIRQLGDLESGYRVASLQEFNKHDGCDDGAGTFTDTIGRNVQSIVCADIDLAKNLFAAATTSATPPRTPSSPGNHARGAGRWRGRRGR